MRGRVAMHVATAALAAVAGYTVSCCLAAGTLIRTPQGSRPIETFAVGDAVVAIDVATGELVATRIVAIRSARRECVRLRWADGELVCTPDHPLYAPELGEYRPASDFVARAVTRLQRRQGTVEVDQTESWAGMHEVFDISVASPHHNFVANGVVVHNKTFYQPDQVYQCDPSNHDEEQCPEDIRCCSDDPAAIGGGVPAYLGGDPSAEPLFAAGGNARSRTGQCSDGELSQFAGSCAHPCNPTWSDAEIDLACEGDECCQTREVTEADCVFDEALGRWRALDGSDALAAAMAGRPSWGRDGGTQQDPDFSKCESFAGDRTSELFFECVSRLSSADQRGLCVDRCRVADDARPNPCESMNAALEPSDRQ